MSIAITKSPPEFVGPKAATPAGNLPLSFMDRLPTSRFLVDSVQVYARGERPAELIREALSKVLVPYYPMAGRLAASGERGELEVACTAEGVLFVEASADCTLEDVNYLELPLMVPKEEILPYFPLEMIKDVIVLMQVTEFKCGGFVVGTRMDHAVTGGSGAGQFMQAMVDMARGRSSPALPPVWGRERIPPPGKPLQLRLQQTTPPLLLLTPLDLQNLSLDVSLERIGELKNQFTEAAGERCSTFDVLLATVWQCRVRAIIDRGDPDAPVRVGFAASARHVLREYVPAGFYGNCGYPLTITAPAGRIADAPFAEVVGLIREAKERLPESFTRWMAGEPEADPFRVPPDYDLLAVSDWSKVGFHELDYGWGAPMHVAPVDDNPFVASCILLRPPAPRQGVRLVLRCVVKEHAAAFREAIMKQLAL